MPITHAFVNGKADGADTTVTRPSDWNAAHVGSSLATAVSVQLTGSDYTTTSATFVDVDATNLSLTMTTGARRAKVTLCGGVNNSSSANTVQFDVLVDGVSVGTANGTWQFRPNTAGITTVAFVVVTSALSAASHTIKLQWLVNGNTGTLYRNAFYPLTFLAEELPI